MTHAASFWQKGKATKLIEAEAMTKPVPMRAVLAAAGGARALATALKISRVAVYNWKRVPVTRVLDVERLTGIPRHDLRPDVYPDEG